MVRPYDNANRRTSTTLANGVVIAYGYDDANQLTSITYTKGATTIGDLAYTYDAAGRRTSVSGSLAATDLPAPVASAVYNANNQLTSWAGTVLTYDLNGNMTGDGTNTYTWNARDELASISGGATASFVYDGLGRRRGKTVGGVQTGFVYDGENFVQELSGGTVTANLVTGGIDELFARKEGATASYPLTDALGSVIGLTDASGVVQTQYSYEPYGKGTRSGATTTNSQTYTGREDDGTGAYYYRARYFTPNLGRFIAEDPIGLAGGVNAYAYGYDNPASFTDPLGLWAWGDPIDQGVVDWVTGFGDAFLIPELIRDVAGIDGGVDKCSALYRAGKLGGFIWGSVPFASRTAASFGATSAGRWMNANRYLRIGPGRWGGELNVPRMSIGKGPGNPHIDLRRGAYVPPIGGPTTCGCP